MYVFTAKDLYYLSSYEHEAIKIELDNIIFAKLKLDLRAEILAVQKLDISIQPVDLNLEQLESLNVATSHIHPDASIQNQKISLFEILLTRGRLHNDWQDKHTEILQDITIAEDILAAQLNVLSKFINSIFAERFPVVGTGFTAENK